MAEHSVSWLLVLSLPSVAPWGLAKQCRAPCSCFAGVLPRRCDLQPASGSRCAHWRAVQCLLGLQLLAGAVPAQCSAFLPGKAVQGSLQPLHLLFPLKGVLKRQPQGRTCAH